MTKSESFFDHPQINHEYIRWRKKIGADKPPAEIADIALSVGEVLRAHFLIAQFFADEEEGLGGIGPRDKNGDLLHSAVSRQFTGFGDERKWTDNFHIAATVLFGLIKNHPFHDGNKRTALLSVMHLLEKQGYTAAVKKRQLENFIVAISDNRHRREPLYKHFLGEQKAADDADIHYIASILKQRTRRFDRSRRSITYRQLNGLLRPHGFELRNKHGNQIAIVRIKDTQTIGHVGFPGMSRQLSHGDLKKVRKTCMLSEKDGYDSKAFFNGAEGMDFLLGEYTEPLRRLAGR